MKSLTLTRPLIIFDLETTSLDPQKARIVEIAFQLFTSEGLQREWSSYVNPEIPIPPETTQTHHISDEDVASKPRFSQLAPSLAKGFTDCDFGGKHIRFDLQVLASEMLRSGTEWTYAGARIIDADRLEQLGEPRSLSHLYEKHTGKKLEGAHAALNDVRATSEVIVAQLQKYKELPRNLDMLHELQWPGWLDTEGKFRFDEKGVARCMFGKYRGEELKAIPPNYWKWIMGSDFSSEIKKIASEAMGGIFPVRRV